MQHFLPVLAVFCCACLPTVQPMGRDAAVLTDAPVTREPPRVLGLRIVDRSGGMWSAAAIPQQPTLHLELSEPVWNETDQPPPVWLFAGAADDVLLGDLMASPLRVATQARIVPVSMTVTGAEIELAPLARLDPGTALTIGAGAWLRAEGTGLRMGVPWATELRVSGAPEAGARVIASWPPDGAAAVPPAIPALALRFDGPVTGVREGIVLRDADGTPLSGVAQPADCATLGWPSGSCATFVPEHSLALGRAHELAVGTQVLDATLAPVGPWSARFTTATRDDEEAPSLLTIPCALDEETVEDACLLADDARLVLRLQASEPVRVALSVAGRTLLSVSPRGGATLVVTGLPPDTAFAALLRIEDLAGHSMERALSLRTTEPLATVSIVEVRSDPRGPEPRQEYVEVLNFGAESVELEGLWLADGPSSNGDALPRQRLAPGQRALIVADDFDPDDPSDPSVPPGVPLVRIGRSLASGGLSNAGEPVFLRDAALRRLSAAPALVTGAGLCLVRTGPDDPRAESPHLFAIGPCTPGTP